MEIWANIGAAMKINVRNFVFTKATPEPRIRDALWKFMLSKVSHCDAWHERRRRGAPQSARWNPPVERRRMKKREMLVGEDRRCPPPLLRYSRRTSFGS